MKLIDIDKIEEQKSHIHYIKEYKASTIIMDKKAILSRFSIQFTIEYRPLGSPLVNVKFTEQPHFSTNDLIENIKIKINEMEKNGALNAEHRKKK